METLKYKLSDKKEDTKQIGEHTLRRIVALKDIIDDKGKVLVHKGDKGGYVESESNLSQDDTCWIYDDAMAYENAEINCAAELHNLAIARGEVKLWGMVKAFDNTYLYGKAKLYGRPQLYHMSRVFGCAEISGDVKLCGNAWIGGDEKFNGETIIERGTYAKYSNEREE